MTKRSDGRIVKAITINGKRKYFYGKSNKEINAKILAFKEEETKGKLFNDVAEEWEAWHENEVSVATTVAYAHPFREILAQQKDVRIRDLTAQDIKSHLNELVSQDYSRKIIARYLSIYSQICAYASERGWVDINVASNVNMPRTAKKGKKREPASASEEQAIIDNIDTWLYPYFILRTGMRRGEALGIQFKDIDRENKVIHITKAVSFEESSAGRIKLPKTDAGIRDVPLLDDLAKVLPNGKPNEYLFGGEHWLHKSAFTRRWNKFREQTGISASPHCLRHSYATALYESGVDVKAAANVLGHSDEALTARLYEHFRQEQLKNVFEKLNQR